jgi:SPOR domain
MRLMVAGSLAAVVIAWFAGSTLLGGGSGQVPVVQPESGPMRVKPTNPGGLQIPGADNAIFSSNGGDGEDKLAPPPQTPDLQALRPPPPTVPAPAPAQPPERAAATPPPASVAQPVSVAQPAATPKPPTAVAASNQADSHPPAVVATGRGSSPSATGASHGTLVQLAALSSEQAARDEWGLLAKRMPQLLAGKQPSVSKVEHDGHVYWRLRTGGFADMAQATMFCLRMRAKGASCSVADF